MHKKHLITLGGLILLVGLILSACQGAVVEQDSGVTPMGLTVEQESGVIPMRLTMGFIPNIQFAPVYVAIEKGYFRDAGFDVKLEYGNEADGVALVGAGDQTFSIASGEQVLLARAQGLPVTYVAAWYQEFPVGVVSLSEAKILVPEDMEDVKIGIPGLFGASYIGFKALLNSGGLSEEDVNLLSIGFNQVEALVTGQVTSAVIYLANEPVVLRSLGHEVDVIRVADYLQLVSNGLVTNEDTINNNPELVTAFIEALLRGIADTSENPGEAYEISKNYIENLEDADAAVQGEVLAQSIKLWQTDDLGYSDPAGWINMQQVLLDMGLLNQTLDLDKAYTNELLP